MSEQLSYNAAVTELEAILADLESSSVDVDQLTTRLSRATELMQFCRNRLSVVEADVSQVLDDMSAHSDGTDA